MYVPRTIPDTTQFLQSLVVSNTPTEIVVWGDFRELGDNNETYQIHDYHLQPTSPCIDRANNMEVPPDVADLNDNGDLLERTPMDFESSGDIHFICHLASGSICCTSCSEFPGAAPTEIKCMSPMAVN